MAEAEIARHVEEAKARWPLLGVTVIHRYGRIAPGENIVLVVTASSHREAAFAAAEFLMDYLKTQRAVLEAGREAPAARPGSRPRTPTMPRRRAGRSRRPRGRGIILQPAVVADMRRRGDDAMIRMIAIAVATLAGTAARRADTRVNYFPVHARLAPARRRGRRRTARSGTAAQRSGDLGLLDPKTGKDENIPIGSGSAPHGVIVGPDGARLDHRWRAERQSCAIDLDDQEVRLLHAAAAACRTPISTPACSTRTASTGSPARTACMATSIRRPASTRAGSRRGAAPTASP